MIRSDPLSTTQMLSWRSIRTACAYDQPYRFLPISRMNLPLGSNSSSCAAVAMYAGPVESSPAERLHHAAAAGRGKIPTERPRTALSSCREDSWLRQRRSTCELDIVRHSASWLLRLVRGGSPPSSRDSLPGLPLNPRQ